MNHRTDVVAQWLSFVYIICAIFGFVVVNGIRLPFFKQQHKLCTMIDA